ncbi:MAG TPA: DNA polymerase Y family protein [Candidatus Angelobacter sp.]|nr:DNA polymerase Y family protein [Candidatus Angelobacter sp.]
MFDYIHLFGCIHLPDFPVQAALRGLDALSPDKVRIYFRTVPIAVLDGPDRLLKVSACNERARKLGIWTGMTQFQAEACTGVELRKRIAAQEVLAHRALLDCGYDFASRVESTSPGTVILDLAGAERLMGSPRQIAQQLTKRSVQAGFEGNIGIAANPDAACCAARGNAGTTIITAGDEAQRLGALPVEILELGPEVLDTLESWGIRDFQSLAALPQLELSQRLGQHGLHMQQLARGEVRRELVPAEPPERFQESLELEEAIDLLEPLGFVLNRVLQHLISRLKMRSLATDEARIDLKLEVHADRQSEVHALPEESESRRQSRLKLPVPTQDGKVLLKLLQLDLAERPPWAPVRKVTIELMPARTRTTQANFFQPTGPEPAKLEITLARLRAVVGETDEEGRERVGFPVVLDSYRPDSFAVLPICAPKQNDQHRRKRPDASLLPIRMFRPPVRARVQVPGSGPARIAFNNRRAGAKHASGPWRNDGEWWRARDASQQEEWDVELGVSGGKRVYRIFREAQTGEWFVQGMYD